MLTRPTEDPELAARRAAFIAAYIPAWLAAISVLGYHHRCYSGKHYTPESVPAEDAETEAEIAWEACLLRKVKGVGC